MRELLPDNIALAEMLDSLPTRSLSARDTETREITAFPTWVSAFASFLAVVAETHPHRVKDMCAYLRLLTREVQKYGGKGWATYDSVFRKNHAGPDARWDIIDPSLHIAHIMSQAQRPLPPCSICNETDHRADDCTLASLQPKVKGISRPPPAREWALPYPRPGPSSGRQSFRPQAGQSPRICLSWNKGACKYPGACSYAHVCATCRGEHPAKSCPLTPQDSAFRQAPPRPPPQYQ